MRSSNRLCRNVFAVVSLCVLALASCVGRHSREVLQARAKLNYTIRYQPDVSPAILSVQLDAAGLHAAGGPLVVRLANWGEWTNAPYTYLRSLRIDGRAVTHDADGVI